MALGKEKQTLNMARRRFVFRTNLAVLIFVALYGGFTSIIAAPGIVLGALLVAATTSPLIWWAFEYKHYIQSLDEFQSLLTMQALAISAGTALLIGSFWGVAEQFLGAPHVNAALLLPVAVLVHAFVQSRLARRYE